MQGVLVPKRLKEKCEAPDDIKSEQIATVKELDERHYRDDLIKYLIMMNR